MWHAYGLLKTRVWVLALQNKRLDSTTKFYSENETVKRNFVKVLIGTLSKEMQGTFHRRVLPSPAVAFSSPEGRVLFENALSAGHLNGYFRLSETFTTQGHPSFCALGSLTMALNALLIDPGRVWQGVWRWFDESMLDCCQPLEVTKISGMTLTKLACVARCNQTEVNLKFGSEVGVDEFREDIRRITSISPDGEPFEVMIVSYNRRALRQSGTGHFSPIGGYEPATDSVLILDVARFKYPPHWVPLKDLHTALQDIDPASGQSRGYMMLKGTTEMYSQCACAPEISSPPVPEKKTLSADPASQLPTPPEPCSALDPACRSHLENQVHQRVESLELHKCKHCDADSACEKHAQSSQI